MLRDAEDHQFDIIIAEDIDRLARGDWRDFIRPDWPQIDFVCFRGAHVLLAAPPKVVYSAAEASFESPASGLIRPSLASLGARKKAWSVDMKRVSIGALNRLRTALKSVEPRSRLMQTDTLQSQHAKFPVTDVFFSLRQRYSISAISCSIRRLSHASQGA